MQNGVEIDCAQMDILSEIPDFNDIIVSNPPYICHREKADMDARVLEYEPHSALFVPDNDPLLFYRRIASIKAAKYLFFEINEAYGNEVCNMMSELGYTDVQLKHDIYGKPRMVFGRIEI
jgi:release factor glutamine methyltransferase